jgi:hypothetical protein
MAIQGHCVQDQARPARRHAVAVCAPAQAELTMITPTRIDCSNIDVVHVRTVAPTAELTLDQLATDAHFRGFIEVMASSLRRRQQSAHATR